jgi:hypothetical protein
MVVHQALHFQAWLHRRQGRLCHCFRNFEGTFYRYAKRYEETQGWQPPSGKAIRRDVKT